MHFVLQSDGERSVIHTELLDETRTCLENGRKVEKPIWAWRGDTEAKSWVAAKKAFGFELTPLQQKMLA